MTPASPASIPRGYVSLVLHAHLPFVRHPEHTRFLEENWLFEAITETYLPLLEIIEGWERDRLAVRIAITLTPTLCAMLQDGLLQERYGRYLDELIVLAEREIHRTRLTPEYHRLAAANVERFRSLRESFGRRGADLVASFRRLQDAGRIEILTCAATHALLPLLERHPPSLRAQLLVARDHYRSCFGRDPRGVWLPECGYAEVVEPFLKEAGLGWFITETHGILHAQPRPRYWEYAPLITPSGLAAFGRDPESARQVWSRHEGYPGDPRYRDFYRDAGFDLDWEYIRPFVPTTGERSFTGIKYHRITGGAGEKEVYDRAAALAAAGGHAAHFLEARLAQVHRLAAVMDRPPIVVCPYDAELFGHWWHEGPEFLDAVVRQAQKHRSDIALISPGDYLARHPSNQLATPSASSWGEKGFWHVWLNEKNEWIYPHLRAAEKRMTELARRFTEPDELQARALKQAARELLLAQASDWPFILHSGTSPGYARKRVREHLLRFEDLRRQLTETGVEPSRLAEMERRDNIFPGVDWRYWR